LTLAWSATLAVNTSVTLQLAASDQATDTAASTFLGPDGTTDTAYAVPSSPIWIGLNGHRFIRYRATLSTTDPGSTPLLTDVHIGWDHRPVAPFALAPSGTVTPTISFTWQGTDVDGDALTYLFQIAPDATFGSPIEQRVRLRDPSYPLEAPLAPGSYFWRVAAFDGVLQSDWSLATTVTVPPPGP
jgi:hypothetical protein